ncbi:RING-H2 finger protein ATL52 [Morella rubra]|uniref:RING-type E3 ubiquitin transferase n=1 Tax=Morella rubra TaxID=262757 RepID=A0A6A1W491_9ROSI|nr:RING-H2 finger protein ATL52 [Morella rubra]
MGSVNNQNPGSPFETYKDCSQGICSIYCPQWCYIIFPPPPPFGLGYGGNDPSSFQFSPLIVAAIGIIACAFILVFYYTVISKYCGPRGNSETGMELNDNRDLIENESLQASSAGLDEALIRSIRVCKYKKGDGLVEGTDCSVCLSEFLESESVRLLPKCNHAFHLPCIDTWLKSHSSCPLCRSNIAANNSLPPQMTVPIQETPAPTTVSALQHQHRNDTILVIEDLEGGVQEEAIVSIVSDVVPKTSIQSLGHTHASEGRENNSLEIRQDELQPFRRSLSMNYALRQSYVSIADILRTREEDEKYKTEILGIGPSKEQEENRCHENNRSGVSGLVQYCTAPGIKRSVSMGRFMFASNGKGNNFTRCTLPINFCGSVTY